MTALQHVQMRVQISVSKGSSKLTASWMQKRLPLSETRHPEYPEEQPFASVSSSSACRSARTCLDVTLPLCVCDVTCPLS